METLQKKLGRKPGAQRLGLRRGEKEAREEKLL